MDIEPKPPMRIEGWFIRDLSTNKLVRGPFEEEDRARFMRAFYPAEGYDVTRRSVEPHLAPFYVAPENKEEIS